jgi:nitrogen fixation/metabolism regulation signal transduction histidine kinase
MRRAVATVDVEGERVARDQIMPAVATAVSVASGLVLLVAFVVGFVVARSTTRKVSDISEVLRRIARGELDARAPPLGDDEIGVLGSDLNNTLDQLEQARRRVAYLQRIGAWQEVARRIAHEIKNPLTPIQLAVQQLKEKAPKDDPAFARLLGDSVEIIEDEIEGLRRMVSSFSQFAKVPEVRTEPLDVGKLLGEFERAYGHLGEGEDDRLEVVAPDGEVRLDGDRQLLKQVLVNLVENAALSARESGVDAVHVRIRARAERIDGEDWVVIEVEDNGPGIDPGRRETVFEPYETTREQGTGLGLAIVKKVVLDHGGEISVDESPDLSGARFVIRVPASAPAASASKSRS